MNDMPLSAVLEAARGRLVSAFNEVLVESKLPAYLVEGIVLEILADVRGRKAYELMRAFSARQKPEEE